MSKASLGAVLLCLLIPCSTPAQARTLELEKGTIRASAGKVVPDRAARGRRAVSLTGTGSLRLRFSTARSIARLTVRARGVRCGGRPRMRVALDGRRVTLRVVRARRWLRVGLAARRRAGRHTLRVALANPRRTRRCRRRLLVDYVVVTAQRTRRFANSAAGAHPAGHGDAAAPRPAPGRL